MEWGTKGLWMSIGIIKFSLLIIISLLIYSCNTKLSLCQSLYKQDVDIHAKYGNKETDLLEYLMPRVNSAGIPVHTVILFIVRRDGRLSHFKICKTNSRKCSNSIIDVLKSMPPWHPAIKNDMAVSQIYRLNIYVRPNV